MVASITIIVLLLGLNAFFVAAEFALVKAKTVRIDTIAAQGSRSAKLTVRIQRNLEAYLAACQLGITMASLGLGWVGEPAVAALLEPVFHALGLSESATHTVSFILGFLIFSSLHIVIGEQVPKTFAIRKAEPVSIFCAYPLHIVYLLVWPLNWCLNQASRGILSWFNVDETPHAEVFTDKELQHLVSESSQQGGIAERKAEMLKNLFDFDQNSVKRVMIPRHAVCSLDIAASPEENRRLALASGHSRFPLIDSANDNQIIGIVLIKSIYHASADEQQIQNSPWSQLKSFSRPAMVVPEAQKTGELFEMMREQRNHIALVVDEYGQLSGIVTLEDLLEEIVGEIDDETDPISTNNDIAQLSPNSWKADGMTTLDTVERHFDLIFPDDVQANSLSGLFMERLQTMPHEGSEIIESGYHFKVLSITDSRVGDVEMWPCTDLSQKS